MNQRQQIMAQYANDTSLTLRSEERNIRQVIYILQIFCMGLRLILKWNKLSGY